MHWKKIVELNWKGKEGPTKFKKKGIDKKCVKNTQDGSSLYFWCSIPVPLLHLNLYQTYNNREIKQFFCDYL